MNSILKIIALLALSLFALCTQVEFNNPLDPKSSNYKPEQVKDEDGNGKADYFEDEDQDGIINGKDSDWKNYVKDQVPPVFSMNGGDEVSVNRKNEDVQEKYTAFKNQVKATDAKDGDVSNRISVNPPDISSLIDETYDVVFIVTDVDNNADTIHRTFKVYTPADVDIVGPRIIIGSTKDTFEFYEGDIYNEPLVSAYDLVDGDVSSTITKIGTVNTTKVGLYTVEYTATDKSNNPGKRTIYVNVLPGSSVDNIYPVISLTGGKDTVKLANGAKWVEPGYTATDNKDGVITDKVTVDTNSFKIKRTDVVCKVIYNVKDNAGNTTTEYRYVLFGTIAPEVPPSFYLDTKPVTKETSYSINLKGRTKTITATDKDGKDITSSIKRSGDFDSSTVGDYTLTYTVEDKDLLKATLKVTITVIDANKDTTKPVIKLKGKNPDTIGVDSVNVYEDPGASAADFVNGISKTVTVNVKGSVDRKTIGSYTLTYTAIDDAGNQTDSIRTVVVKDVSSDLFLRFGVPLTAPLPSFKGEFTKISTVGMNPPSLSTVKSITINWALEVTKFYSFGVQTSDGNPGYYVDLGASVNTLGTAKGQLTIASKVPGLDGTYYVKGSATELVFVKTTGEYAIICAP
jgi:hypothetical protein